jgi:hypothetical protein
MVLMRSTGAQNLTIPAGMKVGSTFMVTQDSTGTTTLVLDGVSADNASGTLTCSQDEAVTIYYKDVDNVIIYKSGAGGGGGGGATAAGATGNVQYKSAGGGLQAEAAFSYDSATNILDVDILTVDTEVYGAGWNGDNSVPTKDATYDEMETKQDAILTVNALTDGSTITTTTALDSVFTSEATATWAFSHTSTYQLTRVKFDGITSATWTFPAGTLVRYEGVAEGDNVVGVSGADGDEFIITTVRIAAGVYYTGIANWTQP